jgi:hypothetical protein
VSIRALLEKIRDALDAAGVPYFFSGSYASSAHGVPRATNDVDVVISPDRQQLDLLLAEFPPAHFAVDCDDAVEALRLRSQFNVIDYTTLTKIDFILRQLTPFDASRFARRRIVEIAGVAVYAASPEDILITKLWWAKLGESERQIRDAAGVLQVQEKALDFDYVERWVAALELDIQWRLARELAG